MKKSLRPGILAVRAVNQYRRREVFAYLGLRYYLENTAALSDTWARQVATDLVLTRTNTPYFQAQHYKEMTESGDVTHRPIFLPGANEALAEAVLLDECANRPGFANPKSVYSYQLNSGNDRSGIFKPYMDGLKHRHSKIAEACLRSPDGVVLFTDIKRFYPSISLELALAAWRKKCEQTKLPNHYRELGEKIINDHGIAGGSENKGILTGPMFSHLIGNLIMGELDTAADGLSAKYFRYVDDITLVGSQTDVNQSLQTIRSKIEDMGFELHNSESSKCFEVSTKDWLKGRHDFETNKNAISWMTLIGDLKRFLLANPDKRQALQNAFQTEGFRIPVQDYSKAIYESSLLEKIEYWAKRPWFRRNVTNVSIESLMTQARWLRKYHEDIFRELAQSTKDQQGFERKRGIPKLRYCLGRLIYLGTEDTLSSLYSVATELPELQFHASVMQAVATGNIDQILAMGTNVAQAVAQSLKASGKAVKILLPFSPAEEQSFAVFLLNDVPVQHEQDNASELMRFAKSGADLGMMKSSDPFIREIACLHGLSEKPRHSSLLETVFDVDEDLALDAISQLQQSLPS
ncbi:RNA-directed DNA polymerase [Methylobacter sp.]|uniref:RNA-directed DNA polymerase n=1 Tax=Methylobacter sp. TaxID=2051955 RepID=UPI00248760D5|nr:RNA-directed DNA polymerase [Methylobacter sp.]MDI1276196.1 RNA-directed DNA polymerase [Methylobacter sp.]MDI1356916.1 RNA-directed DNA polymerase [Methylobacter sp.]